MGNWTDIYTWLISVVGDPPSPVVNSSGYSSTTWSPTELVAYSAACCIVLLGFKLLFWIIRRVFGGAA